MFLFLGPAYLLALLALGVVRGDSRLPRAVALAAGVTGLVFLSWRATTHFGPLAFAPGRLAAEMGEPRFRRFPFGLGFIPASVMAWWIRLNRPVLLPLYLVYRLRAPRRLRLAEAVLGFTLIGTLIMVSGLIVAELYQGEVGTMAVREATGLAWPLVTLGEIAVLGVALRSVWNGAERVLLGLTLALGVWLGPRLFATETATLTMSAGEAGAIAYLRERTPLESVVIEDHGSGIHEGLYLNKLPIVSGLAGRRCVLEYVRRNIDTLHNRRKDILKLFSTDDPEIAQRILELYQVDYVLEYQATPLHFSSRLLRRVYDGGDVRVYAYLGE